MNFEPKSHFQFLLTNVKNLSESAGPTTRPIEDRLAAVGFALAAAPDRWRAEHLEYLASQLPPFKSGGITGGPATARFAALCMGYLLGLRESGRVSEVEFAHAEAVLPGFIALYVNEVE